MNPRDLVPVGVFRALAQGALFWLAVSSLQRHASAQDPPAFVLQAGSTCLQTKLLSASLREAQRARSAAQLPADVSIEVLGSAHDPRTAVISARRSDELLAQRSFSPGPPRCQDFHDAVALAIAMMLETLATPVVTVAPVPRRELPSAQARAPEPTKERNVPGPSWRPVTIVRDRPSAASVRRGSRLVLSTRAAGLLSQHVGSGHGAGVRLELALQRGVLSLQGGLLALFSTHEPLSDSQVRYQTRPLAGSLLGCVAPLAGQRVTLRACVGLLWGQLRAHAQDGQAVRAVHTSSLPWFAAQGGLELALRVGRAGSLFASVVPVYRPRELGVSAQQAAGPALRQKLPHLGVFFTLGLSYDLWHQGSGAREHQ